MKSKFILCFALVLNCGLFGCSTTAQQQRAELTWPEVAAGSWVFTPEIVSERFKHASTNALGSEDDIAEINKTIAADSLRQKLRVTDLRWLSTTLVMAKVRGMEAEYIYVVERKDGRWTVLVHYLQWIS
jgi:hypothetical protein